MSSPPPTGDPFLSRASGPKKQRFPYTRVITGLDPMIHADTRRLDWSMVLTVLGNGAYAIHCAQDV